MQRRFSPSKASRLERPGLNMSIEIPFDEGKAMLDALAEKPLIEKKRYKIPVGGVTWEVDEFLGDNAGLIVAEVELTSEGQAVRYARLDR